MKKLFIIFLLLLPSVWNCSNPDADSRDLPLHIDFVFYPLEISIKCAEIFPQIRSASPADRIKTTSPDWTREIKVLAVSSRFPENCAAG